MGVVAFSLFRSSSVSPERRFRWWCPPRARGGVGVCVCESDPHHHLRMVVASALCPSLSLSGVVSSSVVSSSGGGRPLSLCLSRTSGGGGGGGRLLSLSDTLSLSLPGNGRGGCVLRARVGVCVCASHHHHVRLVMVASSLCLSLLQEYNSSITTVVQ